MTAGLQIFMRRNSVYVAFILGGALLGERVSLPSDLQSLCQQTDACTAQRAVQWTSHCGLWRLIPTVTLLQVLNGAFDRMWENNNKGVSLCAGSADPRPMHAWQLQKCAYYAISCILRGNVIGMGMLRSLAI